MVVLSDRISRIPMQLPLAERTGPTREDSFGQSTVSSQLVTDAEKRRDAFTRNFLGPLCSYTTVPDHKICDEHKSAMARV